jgi:ABC-type transport system involved in cytochrome bd biosynthesis fused ATPase/permease subunit
MKIPAVMLAADAVGALLLGLGIAEHFANTNLVPIALQFQYYAFAMILAGVALMLPMLTFIVKHATKQKSQNQAKGMP